jgi:HD-GYP domain-containing protein (c-di-GMP phosphodiesterase class II)
LPEHGRRVAALAGALAAELALSPDDNEVLERAALAHDLPKLIYPEAISRKRGFLLPDEVAIVRRAPDQVCDLLSKVPFLAPAAAVIRARFEHWDGNGYPRGLRGADIPLPSRILAVADTYDTLLQPRRYRPALDAAAARSEILACAGSQFDPVLVDALERIVTSTVALPAAIP